MSWKTIDSAPKDGTEIDLWCRAFNGKDRRIVDVWWGPSGWRDGKNCQVTSEMAKRATHWMFPPKPPL